MIVVFHLFYHASLLYKWQIGVSLLFLVPFAIQKQFDSLFDLFASILNVLNIFSSASRVFGIHSFSTCPLPWNSLYAADPTLSTTWPWNYLRINPAAVLSWNLPNLSSADGPWYLLYHFSSISTARSRNGVISYFLPDVSRFYYLSAEFPAIVSPSAVVD